VTFAREKNLSKERGRRRRLPPTKATTSHHTYFYNKNCLGKIFDKL
jgi:hypothetical protein